MAEQMDSRQAADAIRGNLANPPPDFMHMIRFAERVSAELGMEPSTFNTLRVIQSLIERNIAPKVAEFPKWVGSEEAAKIVHNEDEEREYLASIAPPEVDVAPDEPKTGGEGSEGGAPTTS